MNETRIEIGFTRWSVTSTPLWYLPGSRSSGPPSTQKVTTPHAVTAMLVIWVLSLRANNPGRTTSSKLLEGRR